MAQLNEYKCPRCNGALAFDGASQQLRCPFCDSAFDPKEFYASDSVLTAQPGMQAADAGETPSDGFLENVANTWADGETDGMYTYICKSCGGEITGDATLAATSCPYCGNPVVFMGAFTGKLRPDSIIPFKLDKARAVSALRQHLEGKRLLPKVFRSENKINDIKGVYIPFWIFDTDTFGDYTYRATTEEHWSDRDYDYIRTKYYKVSRAGKLNYRRIPIDGSEKADDAMTESLEPFYTEEAVNFQTAYLAGYVADKFDTDTRTGWERAKERVANTSAVFFRDTVRNYNTVRQDSGEVTFLNRHAKYALFPVWLLSTTWNGNKYTFAMNGQTGKFVGDLPMSRTAYALWLIGLTVLFGLGALLISALFVAEMSFLRIFICLLIGLLFGLIVTGSMKRKLNSVRPDNYAGTYIDENSFDLELSEDEYLYDEVRKSRRPDARDSD